MTTTKIISHFKIPGLIEYQVYMLTGDDALCIDYTPFKTAYRRQGSRNWTYSKQFKYVQDSTNWIKKMALTNLNREVTK